MKIILRTQILLIVLLTACSPAAVPSEIAVSSEVSAAATDPQPVATSRGPDLIATDPTTVSLSSGGLQLVEFFRFT